MNLGLFFWPVKFQPAQHSLHGTEEAGSLYLWEEYRSRPPPVVGPTWSVACCSADHCGSGSVHPNLDQATTLFRDLGRMGWLDQAEKRGKSWVERIDRDDGGRTSGAGHTNSDRVDSTSRS